MNKKRGLSVEEKRARLLEVFHETGEVFVLKEIEKLGTKKGITPQSIKDILQSLIDDDLVHQEKIGSANYFWSFPSEASLLIERDRERTQQSIDINDAKREELSQKIEEAKPGRERTEEHGALEEELAILKKEVVSLHAEMVEYSDADPEVLARIQEGVLKSKNAANRWLDNLYALQSWCRRQFPGMEREINNLFEQNGIDGDTDYLE